MAAPVASRPTRLGTIDRIAREFIQPAEGPQIDFAQPAGEPALIAPDSVSWQVFRNPISLFVGGITAVLLELAEPRVRSGIWDHSTFRANPLARMKRTGLAAMITVYGARSIAERAIANVGRLHTSVGGSTPDGTPYKATDTELLNWVQATARFGFIEAYTCFVRPLSMADKDRFYAEAQRAAKLYGAVGAPKSVAEQQAMFAQSHSSLESSGVVFEFLDILRKTSILPGPFRTLQPLLIRAATHILPQDVKDILGFEAADELRPWQVRLVRGLARFADRMPIRTSPSAQACLRLGLPVDYLMDRARSQPAVMPPSTTNSAPVT